MEERKEATNAEHYGQYKMEIATLRGAFELAGKKMVEGCIETMLAQKKEFYLRDWQFREEIAAPDEAFERAKKEMEECREADLKAQRDDYLKECAKWNVGHHVVGLSSCEVVQVGRIVL